MLPRVVASDSSEAGNAFMMLSRLAPLSWARP